MHEICRFGLALKVILKMLSVEAFKQWCRAHATAQVVVLRWTMYILKDERLRDARVAPDILGNFQLFYLVPSMHIFLRTLTSELTRVQFHGSAYRRLLRLQYPHNAHSFMGNKDIILR